MGAHDIRRTHQKCKQWHIWQDAIKDKKEADELEREYF
jgi:hypothetical protein